MRLPKREFPRRDTPRFLPSLQEKIDNFSLEIHLADLHPPHDQGTLRDLLHRFLPNRLKYNAMLAMAIENNKLREDFDFESHKGEEPEYEGEPPAFSMFVDITARVIIAIVIGLTVLIPMTLMVFLTTRRARIIIVAISILCFNLGMALLSRIFNHQTQMTVTAAYAAVLVVYIGTSTQTT